MIKITMPGQLSIMTLLVVSLRNIIFIYLVFDNDVLYLKL